MSAFQLLICCFQRFSFCPGNFSFSACGLYLRHLRLIGFAAPPRQKLTLAAFHFCILGR
jgi:hypothetical protein